MPNRVAFGCTSCSSRDRHLSFHKIPSAEKSNEIRKRWLTNIRRAGDLPKDSGFFICSNHFEQECFQRDMMVRSFNKLTIFCFFF